MLCLRTVRSVAYWCLRDLWHMLVFAKKMKSCITNLGRQCWKVPAFAGAHLIVCHEKYAKTRIFLMKWWFSVILVNKISFIIWKTHLLKCRKFHLNTSNKFTVRVTERWKALIAQSGWEASFSGVTQNLSGHSPEQPAPGNTAWAGGWTRWFPVVLSNLTHPVVLWICLSFSSFSPP